MRKNILFTFMVFLPLISSAGEIKAFRPLDVDYSFYEQRAIREDKEKDFKILRTTPLSSARVINEEKLPRVTGWKSIKAMQERFEKIRDSKGPGRISWAYSKDGSWVRASMFNRAAFRMFIPIPDKVFAFGNLNFSGGSGWWFNVAPIVQIKNKKYVLDPVIDFEKPLPLKEWLARIGEPQKIKVAICKSGTYSPLDNCYQRTDGMELKAFHEQKKYLELEKRQIKSKKQHN